MERPAVRRARHRAHGDAAPHGRAEDGNMPSLATVTKGRPTSPVRSAMSRSAGTGPATSSRPGSPTTRPGRLAGHHAGSTPRHRVEAEHGRPASPGRRCSWDAYARLCAAVLSCRRRADHGSGTQGMGAAERPARLTRAGIVMAAFRARVAGIMNGAPVRPLVPAKDATGRPTLRRGAKGDDVKVLQAAIGVTADGTFGAMTEASLRAYQRAHGLVADGIAGPGTWAAIDGAKAAADMTTTQLLRQFDPRRPGQRAPISGHDHEQRTDRRAPAHPPAVRRRHRRRPWLDRRRHRHRRDRRHRHDRRHRLGPLRPPQTALVQSAAAVPQVAQIVTTSPHIAEAAGPKVVAQ